MNVSAIRSEWVGHVMDGRFTLLHWLGGSERSSVFLTEVADGAQRRKAILKIFPADAWDAEARQAGWAASARLAHPNVTTLLYSGACQVDGVSLVYAVTEYAEEILADILTSRPLTPEETGEMLTPLLDALAWLHGKGLVHGHLKPANVLVVDDQLKLSGEDLRVAGPAPISPAPGIYDAPERAAAVFAPPADLWSLGITLVETLTQRRPLVHPDATEDPEVSASVPEPFAAIARGCLRTDPARRFIVADIRSALGAGKPAPENAETPTGKVPALARLGILVVPLIVISAAFAVHEVSVHMRAQMQAQMAAQTQAQNAATPAPPASQEKPSAGTPSATQTSPEQTPVAAANPAPTPPSQSPAPAPQPAQEKPPIEPPRAPQTSEPASSGAVASQVMPEILPEATQSIHGKFTVRIHLDVDAAGNVTDAGYDSEGPSKYFARQTLDACRRWKFKPAAAPSHWIVQYVYKESGTDVTRTQVEN